MNERNEDYDPDSWKPISWIKRHNPFIGEVLAISKIEEQNKREFYAINIGSLDFLGGVFYQDSKVQEIIKQNPEVIENLKSERNENAAVVIPSFWGKEYLTNILTKPIDIFYLGEADNLGHSLSQAINFVAVYMSNCLNNGINSVRKIDQEINLDNAKNKILTGNQLNLALGKMFQEYYFGLERGNSTPEKIISDLERMLKGRNSETHLPDLVASLRAGDSMRVQRLVELCCAVENENYKLAARIKGEL